MILILMLLQKSCYSFLWQTVLSNMFGLLTKWTLSFWRPQLFAGTVCLLTAQRFSCSTMKKKHCTFQIQDYLRIMKNDVHVQWFSCSMSLIISLYKMFQNMFLNDVPNIIISLYHYIIIHYVITSLYHCIVILLNH